MLDESALPDFLGCAAEKTASNPFSPGTEMKFVRIGKIVGTHGLKGNLKVYSDAESLLAFTDYGSLFIREKKDIDPDASWKVTHIQPHKGPVILICLAGVTTREAAEALVGGILCVERDHFPEPEDGYYYWADLMGLEVRTLGGERLGTIRRLFEAGGNDLFEVVGEGREIFIPANAEVVREVVPEEGYLVVELPEGLLDL